MCEQYTGMRCDLGYELTVRLPDYYYYYTVVVLLIVPVRVLPNHQEQLARAVYTGTCDGS